MSIAKNNTKTIQKNTIKRWRSTMSILHCVKSMLRYIIRLKDLEQVLMNGYRTNINPKLLGMGLSVNYCQKNNKAKDFDMQDSTKTTQKSFCYLPNNYRLHIQDYIWYLAYILPKIVCSCKK